MRVAIVTDSTADIPTELAEKHNIHVVPAILVINGNSIEDGKGMLRQDFYTQLPDMPTPPTTATPSAGTFENLFENLLQAGYQAVFSIHVSSLLSGIFNTAQLAAQSFHQKVKVIDSQQLSLGIGFQVLAAAKAAAEGLSDTQIAAQIATVRDRIRVAAMLDTLEYVRRSGRVSWAKARIGSLLRIKPFVEIRDGQVLSLGQARTRKKGITHLKELVSKVGEIEHFAMLHTNAEAEAHQILAELNLKTKEPPLLVNVTTIVGTHVGPNGLGFAAVVK